MKKNCQELDALLTPYLDGEVTPDQCAAIEAHLAECPPCQRRADAEAGARAVVRRCRDRLREPAPAALHAACRQLAQQPHAGAVGPMAGAIPRLDWRWWAPVSLAATLLLAIAGVVGYGLISEQSTALASHLATDHLRCWKSSSTAPAADRAQMQQRWQQARGWTIALPASKPGDELEFITLRRCLRGEGEVAHALFRDRGRLVSLFIFQDGNRRRANMEILGQRAAIWSQHGRSYAIIADVPPAELDRLVARFSRVVE